MNSRLKILIAEKEMQERTRLGIRRIADESGASVSTVQGLLNNTLRRIPVDDLGAICRYLGCDVGDILSMQEAG